MYPYRGYIHMYVSVLIQVIQVSLWWEFRRVEYEEMCPVLGAA
jgi:hypothetical protein